MLFVSQLSDMFGRRTVFVTAFWVGAALGSASALVPSHMFFVVIRFMQGVFAVVISSIVHCIKEKRYYSGPVASVLGVLYRAGDIVSACDCTIDSECFVVCILKSNKRTTTAKGRSVTWALAL